MGKNTKIICTVVPNGKSETGNQFFFSVFLTPRLPDSGILKDYFEIQYWPDFIDFFRKNKSLKARVNNLEGSGGSYSIEPNSSKVLESQPIFDRSKLHNINSKVNHKDIWSKLFQTNTPVKGWIINEGENKIKVMNLYNIEELKKHLKDEDQKETLGKFLKGEISLEELFDIIKPVGGPKSNLIQLLNKLKLQFQDLGKVKMSEDEIKLRNKENQEFHKKISILADYPHLLRLTGWIHDFSITVKDNFSYKDKNGTDKKWNIIKLDGLTDFMGETNDYSKWANFINEIDFKTPWTYFNPDDFTIRYADLPKLNYFEIKNGFIKQSLPSIYDIRAKQFDIGQLTQKLIQTLEERKQFDLKDAGLTEKEIKSKYGDGPIFLVNNYRKEVNSSSCKMIKEELTSKYHFDTENDLGLTDSEIEKKYDPETLTLVRNYRMEKDSNTTEVISNGIGIQIQTNILQSIVDNDPDTVNQSMLLQQFDDAGKAILDSNGKPVFKKNDELNIDDYIFFGHNLDTGYWIDVRKETESNFSSLCLRTANYAIDKSPYSNKKKLELFIENFEDEPWIAESAQAGKSGNLYTDEELCRWNNWSLTCPHIGNYPQDETTTKENHEFNDIELQNIRPYAKIKDQKLQTLPTLRFGQQYFFRIKVVDICGNSPSQKKDSWNLISAIKDKSGNNYELDAFTIKADVYKRLEQVNPPTIHFAYPIYSITKDRKTGAVKERIIHEGHEGEDLLTLVIKTKIHNGVPSFVKNSERVVSAPKSSLHFVEVHGVLDTIFQSQYLRIYDKAGYVPQEPSIEHYSGKSEIPYLTDPSAIGFKLNLTDKPRENSIADWKTKGEGYLERIFNSILLTSSDKEDKSIKLGSITPRYKLTVFLKPGTISNGTLGSTIDEKPNGTAASIFNTAYALSGGVYTNPIDIKFIHAVQKPIVRNEDNKNIFTGERYTLEITVRDRTPSSDKEVDFAELKFIKKSDRFNNEISPDKFPVSTSGEFKLNAKINEVVLDPEAESGYKIVEKQISKLFSNLDNDNKLKCEDDGNASDFLKKLDNFSHSFGNTKHYKATYQIEAISRFKEYFPKETEFSVLGDLLNEQGTNTHIIKNSTKPDAIMIDSINLVFNWNKKNGEVSRIQNKYKIYFKGDAYSSGEGEKIAVLFLDRSQELTNDGTLIQVEEDEKGTIPDDCEGLVSEFGSDPTVFKDLRTRGIDDDHFFINTKSLVGKTSQDIIDIRLLQRGEQRFSTPFATITTQYFVKAAIYEILWDKELKRFYCEIEIDPTCFADRYTPFIKFALCRYQKHSIRDIQTKDLNNCIVIDKSAYDFRFSNVVMSPQVQSFPKRVVKKAGSNFILDTNNIFKKDFDQKPNEFWLVIEPNNDNDFATLIECNTSEKIVFKSEKQKIELDGTVIIDSLKIRGHHSAYIEEYEYYEVNENKNFQMSESETEIDGVKKYYNPRNDIRKRLVFTYKLNNL